MGIVAEALPGGSPSALGRFSFLGGGGRGSSLPANCCPISNGKLGRRRLMILFAIAVWSRHNYKVSTSALGPNGAHALDRPRVVGRRRRLAKDAHVVLIDCVTVIESALVLIMLLMVLLAAKFLCRARPAAACIDPDAHAAAYSCGRRGGGIGGSGHARQQQLVTVSGVFWAEGGGKRIWNKLVFTFTSRRRGRQGARDSLLAGLCRTWS